MAEGPIQAYRDAAARAGKELWWMWASGFVYGVLAGGVGGFWIALKLWI